ncbi:MAG: glutamate--tRNA ligase, partial [Spirochaetota bacterium]
ESPNKSVRTRFAPSPTGFFHIGSARTVLFNWLFAKQNNGKFVLRIEDTDVERSTLDFEKDIIDGIKWLGLNIDEGVDVGGPYKPYRQSERLDIYERYLRKLLDEEKAYYCFCSKEQLEADRQAMLTQGLAPKYGGRCRRIKKDEAEKKARAGEQTVIRFRVPETEVEFADIIRGKIKFDASLIGDIVIAKNSRSPLFNFSNAVDDAEMKITHVIRGEDHLSNTPKQILIQKALGFETPYYAHLPLILTPDRKKMSKRYLETALADYAKEGYLKEAIINFLAFLGWHPKEDKEILGIGELVKEFDLKRVQKAGAVFNIEKLEWLNGQYVRMLSSEELAKRIKSFVPDSWSSEENKEILMKAVSLEKERIKKLSDFKESANFFFELPDYDEKLLAWPRPTGEEFIMNKEKTSANLKLLSEEIDKIFKADFNKENIEEAITPLTAVWGRGDLLWPLRAALSGREASPGPFEIMEVLGKEETLRRINLAIEKLQ